MRFASLVVLLAGCASAVAQEPPPLAPATQPVGKFPFMRVDARNRVIEIECEALHCGNPLEFFVCLTGTNEHEAVLRSKVKPSHVHAALLMLGLEAGKPVHYSEAAKRWMPPEGPPVQLSVRYRLEREGIIERPAYRLMRDVKTKKEMQPMTWIFAGSNHLPDGQYAADRTGYLVSVVNFAGAVIDIPKLASNANETLVWETNTTQLPAAGSPVTLVIQPVGAADAPAAQPATQPAGGPIDEPLIEIDAQGSVKLDHAPVDSVEDLLTKLQQRKTPYRRARVAIANAIEDNATARKVMNALSSGGVPFLTIPQASVIAATRPRAPAGDEADLEVMRQRWERFVAPHGPAVRDAARTHYEVMRQLRAEQQRHIDEADKIQRLIDELEKKYQDLTTPQPAR